MQLSSSLSLLPSSLLPYLPLLPFPVSKSGAALISPSLTRFYLFSSLLCLPLGKPGAALLSPSLVQVTVMARHGDRTQWNPDKCWRGDIAEYSCGQNTLYAHSELTAMGDGEVVRADHWYLVELSVTAAILFILDT